MNFDEIPNDNDTKIISTELIKIEGIECLKQEWLWEGIKGKSIIVPTESIKELSENRLMKYICGLQTNKQELTKANKGKYIFYNYQFEM